MYAPADYAYDLPDELIAQHPTDRRDGSRLLCATAAPRDAQFEDLPLLLPTNAVVVVNDTRVIPARVIGTKPSGGKVELLLLEPEEEASTQRWRCIARGALRRGQTITVGDTELVVASDRDGEHITIEAPSDVMALLERHGHMPLPPYIARADDTSDRERYQTMFARAPGAVAAPTAGLHMTPAIATALEQRGIALATVTLHVGWGTFAPIRVADLREHHMHRERFTIPERTAELVASGRPIVALGTTTLRALEAAARDAPQRSLTSGNGSTELFIYPGSGHRFRAVDYLVTNFHLPESTLLMLVCAFAGKGHILDAYRHAVAARYRFFSYGDAMLVRCADTRAI